MNHPTSTDNINQKQGKGQAPDQEQGKGQGPFSSEVPELLEHHFKLLHNGSGISVEVIKERGYQSVLGKTALKEAGFSKAQQRAPGILIPLHGVDGSIVGHQYKSDHPRKDAKRGRIIKYENPLGSSIRLDVPPRCQAHLGDPNIPIWFTEGAKKADSLATRAGPGVAGIVPTSAKARPLSRYRGAFI